MDINNVKDIMLDLNTKTHEKYGIRLITRIKIRKIGSVI